MRKTLLLLLVAALCVGVAQGGEIRVTGNAVMHPSPWWINLDYNLTGKCFVSIPGTTGQAARALAIANPDLPSGPGSLIGNRAGDIVRGTLEAIGIRNNGLSPDARFIYHFKFPDASFDYDVQRLKVCAAQEGKFLLTHADWWPLFVATPWRGTDFLQYIPSQDPNPPFITGAGVQAAFGWIPRDAYTRNLYATKCAHWLQIIHVNSEQYVLNTFNVKNINDAYGKGVWKDPQGGFAWIDSKATPNWKQPFYDQQYPVGANRDRLAKDPVTPNEYGWANFANLLDMPRCRVMGYADASTIPPGKGICYVSFITALCWWTDPAGNPTNFPQSFGVYNLNFSNVAISWTYAAGPGDYWPTAVRLIKEGP